MTIKSVGVENLIKKMCLLNPNFSFWTVDKSCIYTNAPIQCILEYPDGFYYTWNKLTNKNSSCTGFYESYEFKSISL